MEFVQSAWYNTIWYDRVVRHGGVIKSIQKQHHLGLQNTLIERNSLQTERSYPKECVCFTQVNYYEKAIFTKIFNRHIQVYMQ